MGTNSPAGLLLFSAFMGVMLWMVWLGWRRSQFKGVSEVSASEQAIMAQEARALYVGPEFKLSDPLSPSEFDRHLLVLFDSIEANRDDIDANLEALRVYLKSSPRWDRLKNKQKLRIVYSNIAAYLVRGKRGQSRMGMQQLLANWRKVGRLASVEEVSGVPETWIRPLVNDSVSNVTRTSGGTSRGVLVLNPNYQAVMTGLFFSLTVTMITYIFRPDLPITTWLLLSFGIFFAVVIAYKLRLIKPYKR